MSKDSSEQPSQIPPGYFMPYGPGTVDEDEIDLFELWMILWKKRSFIILLSLLCAVAAVAISLQMPNYFKADLLLTPAGEEKVSGGGSLLGGLGGLASLAGVSVGGGGNVQENLAVLTSRKFLWRFIEDQKLLPILFYEDWDSESGRWLIDDPEKIPSLWDAYRLFKNILSVSEDKKSGLITVSTEWVDPKLAAEWANELVVRLNDYLREEAIKSSQVKLQYLNDALQSIEMADMRQTLFELITKEQSTAMLANTQREFAFRVIDMALEPDKKSKPKRSLIVVLATILGGMFAVFIVFIRHAMDKRRQQQDDVKGKSELTDDLVTE